MTTHHAISTGRALVISALVAPCLLAAGCTGLQARRGTVLPPLPPTGSVRASASILDDAEIAAAALPPATNLLEAISRLRPEYLGHRSRGRGISVGAPIVYLNNTRLGELETLQQVAAHHVIDVRFLRSAEAQAMLGPSATNTGGAIVVRTRRP